jgi:hypothetical protein
VTKNKLEDIFQSRFETVTWSEDGDTYIGEVTDPNFKLEIKLEKYVFQDNYYQNYRNNFLVTIKDNGSENIAPLMIGILISNTILDKIKTFDALLFYSINNYFLSAETIGLALQLKIPGLSIHANADSTLTKIMKTNNDNL